MQRCEELNAGRSALDLALVRSLVESACPSVLICFPISFYYALISSSSWSFSVQFISLFIDAVSVARNPPFEPTLQVRVWVALVLAAVTVLQGETPDLAHAEFVDHFCISTLHQRLINFYICKYFFDIVGNFV